MGLKMEDAFKNSQGTVRYTFSQGRFLFSIFGKEGTI